MADHGSYNNPRYMRHADSYFDNDPASGPSTSTHDPQLMSPAYNPYQTWTPALAPIVGSPSVPPGGTIMEQDIDDMYGDIGPEDAEEDVRERTPSRHTIQEPIADNRLPDIEQGVIPPPLQPPTRSRFGNFIGGFVSTLKHIPNAMVKNNPRGTIHTPQPGYEPDGPTGTVFNSPRVSYYSSSPNVRTSRISLQPNDTSTPYVQPVSMPIPEVPEPPEDNPRTTSSTNPVSNYQDPVDDGTTAVHHGESPAPSLTSSPVQVQRGELADYEKTQTPYPFTNPEDTSFASYADRIHRLFTDIINLPWMNIQITDDYTPELDSSRGRKRPPGPPVSWYTPKPRKEKHGDDVADLHVSAPIPQLMIQTIPPTPTQSALSAYYGQSTYAPSETNNRLTLTASPYTFRTFSRAASEGATAIRPLRTPGTGTSIGGLPSPGASSHGLGAHSITYSYHYATPPPTQNTRGYPSAYSAISTPQTRREPDTYLSPPPPR
ncbi:hypothetical protein QCA50_016659 [Cerrena zonata]|uniref:Uncharacterized protein n=1 Tax=Cerrena zonata TaxID=2478898 RepID=A0AAW0FSB6_9APHY